MQILSFGLFLSEFEPVQLSFSLKYESPKKINYIDAVRISPFHVSSIRGK